MQKLAKIKELAKLSGNIAFLDAEFNRIGAEGEIISVGIYVCDKNYKLCETDYFTVKPLKYKHLTNRIKELTGLSQEDIDNGKDFYEASCRISKLCRTYNVQKIFTWGDEDERVFRDSKKIYIEKQKGKSPAVGTKNGNFKYINKIYDISEAVKRKYNLPYPLSLAMLCEMCEVSSDGHHNAGKDAEMLYECTKKIIKGEVSKEAENMVCDFYNDKYLYNNIFLKKNPVKKYTGRPVLCLSDNTRKAYSMDIGVKAYIDEGIKRGYIKSFATPAFYSFEDYKKMRTT